MSKKFLTPIGLATLASDPVTASEGDMYYNTTYDIPRIYKNGVWEDLSGGINIYSQPDEPNTDQINIGDLWLDTDAEIVTKPSFDEGTFMSKIESYFNMSASAVDTSPRTFGNSATLTSGYAYFTFFSPLKTKTVSSISMASAGTATQNATLIKFGLYTFDGTTATLVAKTSNDNTIFTSSQTLSQRYFSTEGGHPSTYELVSGQRYAIAVVIVSSSPGNAYLNNPTLPIVLSTIEPRMSGIITGQSDLPTTASSFTNTTLSFWGRLI
jgi:hypothetical protein